jgi:hypothetical protein
MNTQLRATAVAITLLAMVQVSTRCNNKKTSPGGGDTPTGATQITPVPLPANIVPGFRFPEDSTTVYKWINDSTKPQYYDSASVYQHAWGVWAGLTANSGQSYAGNPLLVYETWPGLGEVQQMVMNKDTKTACEGTFKRSVGRVPLVRPKQFEHAARNAAMFIGNKKAAGSKPLAETNVNQWVTVSYSPDAACFVTQNQLMRQSVINKYYTSGGLGAIPSFPNKSITVKPTYLVFENNKEMMKMPVWITAPNPADSAFGPDNFGYVNNWVYVDPSNGQTPGKALTPVDSNETDGAKIKAATCNLNDFIYLTVDQQMASFMNRQDSIQGLQGGGKAVAGQIAILVGMHVTTKEISNWTWQSYYWTPNPAQPGAPSSNLAASLRPKEITGAAAHYACVAAYVMLTPNNAPNAQATGSMFGYNPYLEGGFGPTTFSLANTYKSNYTYGTQSNCMSCHALAVPNTNGQYATDQTIDLKGSYFRNQVSLDFAWSLQTALISDTIPYWNFSK